ncbi:phospholipase A2 inhibitor 31 kDa subunit-like [Emys orbicularis]|uniref:phospholipase A2 inhibitor 31 kDa subunit-like n=1 Tax=Emys orbicularis TaxID=82168 RepID=UPI0031FDC8CC
MSEPILELGGACLQCEVCDGPGTSCTGDLQTCSAGEDTCGFVLIKFTLVREKMQYISKRCASSSKIKATPRTMNFGKAITARISISSCERDNCSPTTVKVPPADTEPNGLHCPACVGMHTDECSGKTLECTGTETKCINIAGTIPLGTGLVLEVLDMPGAAQTPTEIGDRFCARLSRLYPYFEL